MNQSQAIGVKEVLRAELDEISLRRQNAGLNPNGGAKRTSKDVVPEVTTQPLAANSGKGTQIATVGLALSGGGIRSGSIGLGFLQALYRRGILRHIDYLSTVSGGGYAGAFFHSLVLDSKFPSINWTPAKEDAVRKNLDFLAEASGKQPGSLSRLLYAGKQLQDPIHFLSHWFLGVLFLNLWAFSGLVAAAALLAFAFRSLDYHASMLFLREMGIVSDQGRAILIPVIASFSWLLLIAFSSRWRWLVPFRGPLFIVSCVLWALGFFTFLTIADNYAPIAERSMETPGDFREAIWSWTQQIQNLIIAAIFGALLPLMNPMALLRSGTQAKHPIEGWLFGIVSRAFLFGVPLLIFAHFAKENISNYQGMRTDRYMLLSVHTNRFESFWRRLASEAAENKDPGKELWGEMLKTNPPKVTNDLQLPSILESYYVKRAKENGFSEDQMDRRWLSLNLTASEQSLLKWKLNNSGAVSNESDYLRLIVHRLSNYSEQERKLDGSILNLLTRPFRFPSLLQRYKTRRDQTIARDALTDLLNDQLKDPKFVKFFDAPIQAFGALNLSRIPAVDPERLQELCVEARRLVGAKNFNELDAAADSEVRKLNWRILNAQYGSVVRGEETVFARVVSSADQNYRLQWGVASLGVFLLLGLTLNLNALSLHGFYRWKLGKVWINESPEHGSRIPLAGLNSSRKGAPYPLINAAMNLMGFGQSADHNTTARFTFSPRFCGSKRTGYVRTDFYGSGDLDLSDAMAISGAALNPMIVTNPLARTLFLLLNFRLGKWLPNPAKNTTGIWWSAPLRLLSSWVLWKPEDRIYSFVTDGGHDENTGVGALLERRCRVIIAVDASQDPQYQFADVLKLIRCAAAEQGIEIVPPHHNVANHTSPCQPLKFDQLKPVAGKLDFDASVHAFTPTMKGLAASHYLLAEILYPKPHNDSGLVSEEKKSYLILVKPNLTGDEPTELLHYRLENPVFPHDPTVDQFYEPRRFSCFRQLGEHLGDVICDELFPESYWGTGDHRDSPWLAESWTQTAIVPLTSTFACNTSEVSSALLDGNEKVSKRLSRLDDCSGVWHVHAASPVVDPCVPKRSPLTKEAIGVQYTAKNRELVRYCLCDGNFLERELAADLLRLADAPIPPDEAMYATAVEDLIAGFEAAENRRDVGFQIELARVISYYISHVQRAQDFLADLSTRDSEAREIREFAEHILQETPRKREPEKLMD